MKQAPHPWFFLCGYVVLLPMILLPVGGCASLAGRSLVHPVIVSLEQQEDLDLISDGAPALLLMLDGLIAASPRDRTLLAAGARGHGLYSSILLADEDPERARAVAVKARNYGQALLRRLLDLEQMPFPPPDILAGKLARIRAEDAPLLFWAGFGWGSWIQAESGSPAAVADLGYLEEIMLRVVALDERYYHGAAHVFLGLLYGSRPAMFGGKPQASRAHFERALEIGGRRFLPAQVYYADTYARFQFDRELFAALLNEVVEARDMEGELAASCRLAKRQAEKLLLQVDDIF